MPNRAPDPLLLFRAGDHRLALPARDVREVLPLLPIARPPTLPRPLAGFVDVRGETLPVLAPALLFDGGTALGTLDLFSHLIRPHGPAATMPCLLVDRVEDMVTPDADAIRPVEAEASHNGAILAEVTLPDGPAHLLSLARLLSEAERERLAALAAQAEARAADWTIG
ncbi:chemotaxis protein CheW [Sphingomonas sp. MJ1 (PH-R8)]|uniref:chemotaxis protein CheW n=1 Tax=Sphingomonas sp. MJ1 (PH-R8) TaxID=3112950 RepID=UPI003A874B07